MFRKGNHTTNNGPYSSRLRQQDADRKRLPLNQDSSESDGEEEANTAFSWSNRATRSAPIPRKPRHPVPQRSLSPQPVRTGFTYKDAISKSVPPPKSQSGWISLSDSNTHSDEPHSTTGFMRLGY